MCHRQILAAPVATSDTHALNSRHTGEHTGGTDVDAQAMTAYHFLVARHGEDSGSNPKGSSNSKRGGDAKGTTTAKKKLDSKSDGEPSSGDATSSTNNSKNEEAKKERKGPDQSESESIRG